MRPITVREVEEIIFEVAKQRFSFDEPIPDFGTRYANILESCLESPFQTFEGKDLYPGLAAKTGVMFYLMVKNHPFQNGNKRIAMASLFYALFENKKWLNVNTQELYNFAMWVAQSPPQAKKQTVDYIEQFLNKHIVVLKE
ncbi:MAG: type II toxin-antitoxin system death-on-curing family toxin [Candidatus Omnitrophota bacterium]